MTTVDGPAVLRAILDAVKQVAVPLQEKGREYTCSELAGADGVTYNRMKSQLEQAVEAGTVTCREVRTPEGRNAVAYRPVGIGHPADGGTPGDDL